MDDLESKMAEPLMFRLIYVIFACAAVVLALLLALAGLVFGTFGDWLARWRR